MNWLMSILTLAALSAFLWQLRTVSKYSVERRVVPNSARGAVEVLVHREGIFLMTKADQAWGAFTLWPLSFTILRNRGREWQWAVTVRGVSLGVGVNPPLYHEVCGPHAAAEDRSAELITQIANGDERWLSSAG